MESSPSSGCVAGRVQRRVDKKNMVGKLHSPRFAGSEPVQFRFASLTVVIIWSSRLVGDAYAEAVLPNMALIALDKEAVCGIGLVVVTALVFLVAANASCDLIFL